MKEVSFQEFVTSSELDFLDDEKMYYQLQGELLERFSDYCSEKNCPFDIFWSRALCEFLFRYNGMTLGEIDVFDLQEVVLSMFPSKVTLLSENHAVQMIEELPLFFDFLDVNYGFEQLGPFIQFILSEADEIVEAQTDPDNFGFGKALFHGVDPAEMETEEGIQRIVDAYNESMDEDGSVVKDLIPVTSKNIGRNDPCPCNSGKKYKKCCG